MTATVTALPARFLAERIEDARNDVEFRAMVLRRTEALLEQHTGELEMAREELAALEAQRLVLCGTCRTYHQPIAGACPEPGPCATCGYHPCQPGCFERGDDA